MRLDYEIVHVVEGRVFDVESYELTSVPAGFTQSKPGFYLLLRMREGKQWCNDSAARFVGPFTSATYAILALRELQLRSGAIESEAVGPVHFA